MPKKPEVVEQRTFTDLQKHKPLGKKPEQVSSKNTKEFQPQTEPGKSNIILNAGMVFGIGKISNGNFNELTMSKDYHVWQTKPMISYAAHLHYTFMITPKFGLWTGVGYSNISTNYNLKSSTIPNDSGFTDRRPYKDLNGKIFIRYIKADYDSTVNIKFINIPIGLYYCIDLTKKFSFFIKPGISIGLVNNATAELKNGYIKNYGHYYGQQTPMLQNLDWPELGFGVYYDIVKAKKIDIKPQLSSVAIDLDSYAGFNFILSKHTTLALSGNIQYELNDLFKNQGDYKDIFAKTATDALTIKYHVHKHLPTKIFVYGMAIELIVKF
jgi:hypothetical protein